MGWSESYWDDVKSDLERLRAESEPAVDDGPPAEPTDVAGAGSPPGGPETRGVGAPADLPGGL